MNYNMQGITKTIPCALRDTKIGQGRNQEKHQVLMVGKTTSFKKSAKEKKGNFKKNDKQDITPMKKHKARPKPETECFYYEGNGHWKLNYPKYLAHKKDGKVNKSLYDIHVIDVYFTSVHSNP